MIGELESPIKVIVQQAEQEDKKTEQKATGGLDIEPQSEIRNHRKKRKRKTENFQGKVQENFPHMKDTEPPDQKDPQW